MTDAKVVDQTQREAALDPTRSFIVQAPAGSGKTGLITQRFLVLLARVQRPEEIVAITFTRKAAGEMRARILEALHAAQGEAPEDAHALKTWQLARAVLQRDEALSWELLSHPSRLTIQTIDSLCASLTRQLPMMARFGAQPAIADDAQALYRHAAQQTLADLEQGQDWSPAIEALLRHLDNNLALAESMLVQMLARRDQWLRHLTNINNEPERRAVLESAIQAVIEENLLVLAGQFASADAAELAELLQFASANLKDDHELASCASLSLLPATECEALPQWQAMANFLLTQKGEWRKQATAAIGFPAPSATKDKALAERYKEMKSRFAALVDTLKADQELGRRLDEVRYLPSPHYQDSQWQIIEALCELLVVAVAHLRVVFSERGQVDFSEIAQAAIQALGSAEEPTDLALALDYRIQHMLVDEFQDTAFGQYVLLERLTAGWQPGDGRSLFVVGDPMQSIYRFREAEVGLYLRARQRGIGEVRLEPLNLQVNFRSAAGVVEWVNDTFAQVLPAQDDVSSGAVSYSVSTAFHAAADGEAVTVHPSLVHDKQGEAAQVVELIRQAYQENPEGSVAVLVRTRSHLAEIVPALKQASLGFRAIEIEQLTHRPAVQDLYALTRALLHPADRVAWLAVLRAPWCGLELADLNLLAQHAPDGPLWSALQDENLLGQISAAGSKRLQRLVDVFHPALVQRQRVSLRRWVEGVWLALGGPACLQSETDLADAEVYLRLLEAMGSGAELDSVELLDEQLQQLFALPDVNADARLQLMTIHKSKGLEFDSVILPGLGRMASRDDSPLLLWQERPGREEESELLLAPVKSADEQQDLTYAYLRRLNSRKGEYEAGRLLYVAATRARQRLHLLGHVTVDEKNERLRSPLSGSLLRILWPQLEALYETHYADHGEKHAVGLEQRIDPSTRSLSRLVTAWQLPAPPSSVATISQPGLPEEAAPESLWASEVARHIGTVTHELLQRIAEQGLEHWSPNRVEQLGLYIENTLRQQGVAAAELETATQRVKQALQSLLDDERGRWILKQHLDSVCEYALTTVIDARTQSVVIDRTFVDADGNRWIIDYKTAVHEGEGLEQFFDEEVERYRDQLELYASVMAKTEQRPMMLGLYFPLYGGWRSWQYQC